MPRIGGPVWIWGAAAILYAAFAAWYVNWQPPLSDAEVEAYIARLQTLNAGAAERNDVATLRKFLSEDDGREFFMLNLVRIAPGDVADPTTGKLKPAREVVEGYTKVFMPALFARGGHPAIVAYKAGGYFDAWGAEPDPGWTLIGYMRYRSRRDLAELASDPRFGGAHDFKFAAMPNTFSFPTQPSLLLLMRPIYFVALGLALIAALAHLTLLMFRRR